MDLTLSNPQPIKNVVTRLQKRKGRRTLQTEDEQQCNQCNSSGTIKCFQMEKRARQDGREGGLVPAHGKTKNSAMNSPKLKNCFEKGGKVYICKTTA